MTKVHPTPIRLLRGQAVPTPSRSGSSRARWRLFFKPEADGFARNPKDPLQTAHRTALLVSDEDLFFFSIGISIGLWIVTAAAIAVVTPIALFAIWRAAIAHEFFTPTVATFKDDRDHVADYPLSHSFSP